jgi:hypothetical protein
MHFWLNGWGSALMTLAIVWVAVLAAALYLGMNLTNRPPSYPR